MRDICHCTPASPARNIRHRAHNRAFGVSPYATGGGGGGGGLGDLGGGGFGGHGGGMRQPLIQLLDHLVGNGEQPWRKTEAEYSGGVEVNHELEFGRLDDR